MILIEGKNHAQKVKEELKKEVKALRINQKIVPGLAVVLVGEDAASELYVSNKKNTCEELGIHSEVINLPEDVPQIELIEVIEELNQDPKISGILVQLPLPEHIDVDEVISTINPKKDVDGFHPVNVGKLCIGKPEFVPCTSLGIIHLIKETGIDITGKECVVLGRSNIVGKPASLLMLQNDATVTMCHSKTVGVERIIKNADIVIVAIGKSSFLKGYMLKHGAIVIDVGINRLEDGSIVGDVDLNSVSKAADFVTPVPGGVGPMTVAMLMKNTVKAAKLNNNPYMNEDY